MCYFLMFCWHEKHSAGWRMKKCLGRKVHRSGSLPSHQSFKYQQQGRIHIKYIWNCEWASERKKNKAQQANDGSLGDGSLSDGSLIDGSLSNGSLIDESLIDGSLLMGPWVMGLMGILSTFSTFSTLSTLSTFSNVKVGLPRWFS